MAVHPRGDMYVNLGTQKCSFFLRASLSLVRQLRRHPAVYYAIEEGLLSAKKGYYAAAIMALSQLLNVLQQPTPAERHKVAHELLRARPTKADYEGVMERVKAAACSIYERELARAADPMEHNLRLLSAWQELMENLLRKT